jgi:nitrate/nitrite-specific signal transduction histidine kinase
MPSQLQSTPPTNAPEKAAAPLTPDTNEEESRLSSMRVNWQLKAILPVGFVLLAGLLLFTLATVSLRDPERHAVLIVAGVGAVAICAVSMFVLAYLVQRPMVELQEKMEMVGKGNLDVAVSFSRRNDEIGDLGRNFNQMVQQLRDSREKSNACIALKCRAPSTSRPSASWPPAWPMRFAIRWRESLESSRSSVAISLPVAPHEPW